VAFCSFRIASVYLATSNITEIKIQPLGENLRTHNRGVILDNDSELTEQQGGICVDFFVN